MRDKNLDPELLTDRQQSLKAASMPMHQERVLVHRHAELAFTILSTASKRLSCLEDEQTLASHQALQRIHLQPPVVQACAHATFL